MNRIAVASRAILVVVLVSSACGPSGSSDDNESASNQGEGDYAQVSAGTSNTCALEKTGEAVCWGALKDREDLQIPDGPFMDLDVGRGFACAIAEETGEVSWLGIYRSSFPVSGGSSVDVEAGRSYVCGLREDRSLECWNWREDEGRITSPPSSGDFEKLSVTGAQGCAIDSDGQIQCWGYIGREDYRDPV